MDIYVFKMMMLSGENKCYKCTGVDYDTFPNMPIIEDCEKDEILASNLTRVYLAKDGRDNWRWARMEDPYPQDYCKSLALFNMYIDIVYNGTCLLRNVKYFFVFVGETPYIVIAK